MKIHYFQRYYSKENVATANTMLLLSRLYHYSPSKFYTLLKDLFFSNAFDPEISFNLQEKATNSVLDAAITQDSFKIAVEAKMSDWFYTDQLTRHLEAFHDEHYKVLLTVAPVLMAQSKVDEFKIELDEYNSKVSTPIIHINTTFEKIANAVEDIIDERDYEMQEVMDDYMEYCCSNGLIPPSDSWKYMKMQLSGDTFDFNVSDCIYYEKADRSSRPHDYLGLYKKKSVRAIGKIVARIVAVPTETGLQCESEYGDITEERKEKILKAIEDSEKHNYNLKTIKHRYYFVDEFYTTDYNKSTLRPPMGPRVFDLTQVLNTNDLPSTDVIAEELSKLTWC